MIYEAAPVLTLGPSPTSATPPAPTLRFSVEEYAYAHPDPQTDPAAARLARATVLVVDDEPANVRLLTHMLRRAACHEVLGTTDPAEGVRLYAERLPDLLLLDLRMPGMDGLAVLDRLAEWRHERALCPVLVLTGDATAQAREAALVRGANDFVSKPFQLSEVMLRIGNLLETAFLYRELREHNAALEQTVAERTATLRRDIVRRERVEHELRTSEARYRHLVENASDLIVQTDGAGNIRYANQAAGRLLGRDPRALEGLPFRRLIRPVARRAAMRFYQDQLRRGEPTSYQELPLLARDGHEAWLGISVRLTRDGEGNLVSAQGVARDVTERRQVERIKDEFISVASHELRTPLTSIRAALGLLESGLMDKQPERARNTLRIATRNSERLARLLNDILDLERLNSGAVRLERAPADVGELMAHAAETVRAAAETAGVLLVVAPVQATALLDGDRVGQVLVNLLGNAVKFSPRGGTVWLDARVDEDGATFAVRDQGRGIPEDKLEAVFGRFSQVDASDARERGGTGLGLAICRTIVEAHGGRIWVESREGAGSVFTVRLPADGSA